MKLIVGSRNRKKLAEIVDLIGNLGIDITDLSGYPQAPEVDEDGETFLANARKKASELAKALGEWVLGEDSGLVVPGLDGRPGVYSARYAGRHGDDDANNAKLLTELAPLPEEKSRCLLRLHLRRRRPVGGHSRRKRRSLPRRHRQGAARHERVWLRPALHHPRVSSHLRRAEPAGEAGAEPSGAGAGLAAAGAAEAGQRLIASPAASGYIRGHVADPPRHRHRQLVVSRLVRQVLRRRRRSIPSCSAPTTARRRVRDAVRLAVDDQLRAGADIITDGEMQRVDFNLGFYDYLTGLEPLPPARRWGPPAHDQRSRYLCVGAARRAARAGPGRGVPPAARRSPRRRSRCRCPGPFTLAGCIQGGDVYRDRDAVTEALMPIVNREMKRPGRGGRRLHPARRAELRLPSRPAGAVPRPDRPHGRRA